MNADSKKLDYLTQLLGKDHVETYLKVEKKGATSFDEKRKHKAVMICLSEMDKQQANPWWLSEDHAILAENQLKCNVLLIPAKRFSKILSSSLGRNVSLDEIRFERTKLSKEFLAKNTHSTKA